VLLHPLRCLGFVEWVVPWGDLQYAMLLRHPVLSWTFWLGALGENRERRWRKFFSYGQPFLSAKLNGVSVRFVEKLRSPMERLSRLLRTFRLVQEMDIVKSTSILAMQVRDDDDGKKTKNAAFYRSVRRRNVNMTVYASKMQLESITGKIINLFSEGCQQGAEKRIFL
jgi:hypothetical protein